MARRPRRQRRRSDNKKQSQLLWVILGATIALILVFHLRSRTVDLLERMEQAAAPGQTATSGQWSQNSSQQPPPAGVEFNLRAPTQPKKITPNTPE